MHAKRNAEPWNEVKNSATVKHTVARSHDPTWECLLATPKVAEGGMHAKRIAERWNEVTIWLVWFITIEQL